MTFFPPAGKCAMNMVDLQDADPAARQKVDLYGD
jgi:hypothetical protein